MEREQIEARLNEIADGAERARSELDRLIAEVATLRTSLEITPEPVPETIPGPEPVPEPEPPPIPEPTPPVEPEPIPPPEVPPMPEPPPEPTPPTSTNHDQAARLVALKMAIDGSSREQIEAELVAKFGSADRTALLDEVLARAGR